MGTLTVNTDILHHKRWLVAVSGGSDSMALLHWMFCHKQQYDFSFEVIHIHHHLREASDKEAQMVADYCAKHHIVCHVVHWQYPATTNIEAEARAFRYQRFGDVCTARHLDGVCTAHHRDDQVETILQKVIRGAHLWHITGMATQSQYEDTLICRPLLKETKSHLLQYVKTQDIPYMEDASNQDTLYQRNRIRHQLLPYLKKENPNIETQLLLLSQQLEEENTWVYKIGKDAFEHCQINATTFDLTWLSLHEDRHTSFVWYLCEWLKQTYDVCINREIAQQIEQLTRHLSGSSRIILSEQIVLQRDYKKLVIDKWQKVEKHSEERYTLTIHQSMYLSDREWITLTTTPVVTPPDETFTSYICWPVVQDHITIRPYQAGDKICIAPHQHKRVSRLLIDKKIPKQYRADVKVVEDATQRILGVLPFRQSYLSDDIKTDKIQYIIYYYHD